MKVTVITITYNRAAYLPYALRSLAAQKADADLDLLVVDDGSTDETPEVLAGLQREIPFLRVVRKENGGIPAARNTGLANLLPETEIVTFLDSDDISPPGRFAADLPLLAADPALDGTYGKMVLAREFTEDMMEPAPGAKTVALRGISMTIGLFRRDLIERIGSFDTTLGLAEDGDYLLRILESGARIERTPTTCIYYRHHDSNVTANRERMRRSTIMMLRKSVERRKQNPNYQPREPFFEFDPLQTADFA